MEHGESFEIIQSKTEVEDEEEKQIALEKEEIFF